VNRTYMGIGVVLFMVSLNSVADEQSPYYSAENLADDCVSHKWDQKQLCFGVMHGVLGSLGFLKAMHSPFTDTLCIPPMSAAGVKDTFLSAFYAQRQQFNGMLAGAAVASVLYDRYPCAAERIRRMQEGKEAGDALDKVFKGKKPPN
jgi:hypothetical protein